MASHACSRARASFTRPPAKTARPPPRGAVQLTAQISARKACEVLAACPLERAPVEFVKSSVPDGGGGGAERSWSRCACRQASAAQCPGTGAAYWTACFMRRSSIAGSVQRITHPARSRVPHPGRVASPLSLVMFAGGQYHPRTGRLDSKTMSWRSRCRKQLASLRAVLHRASGRTSRSGRFLFPRPLCIGYERRAEKTQRPGIATGCGYFSRPTSPCHPMAWLCRLHSSHSSHNTTLAPAPIRRLSLLPAYPASG
ncbi:hypothetical protein B0H67DRAFT_145195 [Lasiosphaeris hirsuta]|uniref:Uncharacterized protein n=1 Tax=Lasiosphaeris hirsuta TaxID=260670 RepID=A0AA40E5P9_9PEZI|nr:hypothetical protein B0H67DRAFT_145195 [Lasiosphaeris hirsuta]